MMMQLATKNIVNAFAKLQEDVAKERGDVLFFALVHRDDLFDGSWDLVVAAPWASKNRYAAIEYMVNKIKSELGAEALLKLARVVIFDADDAEVQAFSAELQAGRQNVELRNVDFFGVPTSEVHVLTS